MAKSRNKLNNKTKFVDYDASGRPISITVAGFTLLTFNPATDQIHIPFRQPTTLIALLRETCENTDSPVLDEAHAAKISNQLNQNDRKERIRFLTMAIDEHLPKVSLDKDKNFLSEQQEKIKKSNDENVLRARFEKLVHQKIKKASDQELIKRLTAPINEQQDTLLKLIVLSLPSFALKRMLETLIIDKAFFKQFQCFVETTIGQTAATLILQSDKITDEQKIDLVMRKIPTNKLAQHLIETLTPKKLAGFFVNKEGMQITFDSTAMTEEKLKDTQKTHLETEINALIKLSPKQFKGLFRKLKYELLKVHHDDSLSTSLPKSTTHIVACINAIKYPTSENIQALKERGKKLKHGNNSEELRVLGNTMIELSDTLNTQLHNQLLDSELISLEITLNKMLSSTKIDPNSKKKILDAGCNFVTNVDTMRKNHPTQLPALTLHVMRCEQMVKDLHHEKYSLRRHNEKTKLVSAPVMTHSFADAVVAVLNSVAETIRHFFSVTPEKKSTKLGFFAEGTAMKKINKETVSLLEPFDPFGKNRVKPSSC